MISLGLKEVRTTTLSCGSNLKGGVAMSSWQVTEDAVNALKSLSGELASLCKNSTELYQTLYSEFEDQKDGLGKHSDSIGKLIGAIQDIIQDITRISDKLQIKLNKAAMIRGKAINGNPYSVIASSITSSGVTGSSNGGVSVSSGSNSVTSGSAGSGTAYQPSSSTPSVDVRTIFELESFLKEMDFTDGDASVIQCGGAYKDVTKITTGKQYEAHHIPAKSVFSDKMRELPTIALTKEDHSKTSSYKGRMGSVYKPFIPSKVELSNHKGNIQKKVDQGFLAEMIKDEIYEIRHAFGEKYDGAIKQYIAAMIDYIKKNGTPKT